MLLYEKYGIFPIKYGFNNVFLLIFYFILLDFYFIFEYFLIKLYKKIAIVYP